MQDKTGTYVGECNYIKYSNSDTPKIISSEDYNPVWCYYKLIDNERITNDR